MTLPLRVVFLFRPRLCANCCSFMWFRKAVLVHVPPGNTWDAFHLACEVLPPEQRWTMRSPKEGQTETD